MLLMGGVGNRLFQLAHAKSLIDIGYEVDVFEFPVFIEIYAKKIGWSYHDQWIDFNLFSKKLKITKRSITYIELMILILTFASRKLGFNFFKFDQPLHALSKNRIKCGYFQSNLHISQKSLEELTVALASYLNISGGGDPSVYLRGGDFNSAERFKFDKFLDEIRSHQKINIVTNDISFADKMNKYCSNSSIVNSQSALQDFIVLASSKVMYCSKSTYGFWAARVVSFNGGHVYTLMADDLWELL